MLSRFTPGTTVDRYVIERELGDGTAGVVFLARHQTLGSLHAIKVLKVENTSLAKRMLQEAQLQGRLRHPNIVGVSDFLDVEGMPAIVQEFVDGPSLERLLARGLLSFERVDEIVTGLLRAVSAAHEAGIIHRDIKPANILICQKEDKWVPKLSDFGLVKSLTIPGQNRTRSGSVMGSPGYMAPEQMSDASTVDRRADLFSLGVVVYEMLTGRSPFGVGTLKQLYRRASSGEYPSPKSLREGIPERMLQTIRVALEPDPNQRVKHASDLLGMWKTSQTPVAPTINWAGAQNTLMPGAWEVENTTEQISETGQTFGRYTVGEVLGEGGWGRVYRAQMDGPVGFSKAVALKVLHGKTPHPQATQDLINEARLGGLLKHPNVVEVYDLGVHEQSFYIAMEWVQGGSIREVFSRTGPFSERAVVELALQLCAGLAHAHGLEIEGESAALVHRDLKPSNLLVDPNGLIKIADFGIATTREIIDSAGESQLIRGTPAYMAPEQQWGENDLIGPSTDLFSLGVMLVELLTGTSPSGSSSGVALRAALSEADCNPGLKDALARCIHLEPEERFPAAEVLAQKLSSLSLQGVSLHETLGLDPSLNPVPQRVPVSESLAPEFEPVSLWDELVAGATAVLVALPILFGAMTLLFGSAAETMNKSGVWGYLLIGLSLVNIALLPRLWRRLRHQQPIFAPAWIAFPLGIRTLGSMASILGLQRVNVAVEASEPEQAAQLTSLGLNTALTAESLSLVLPGLLGLATLGVVVSAIGRLQARLMQFTLVGTLGLAGLAFGGIWQIRSAAPLVVFPSSPYLGALAAVLSLAALAAIVQKKWTRPASHLLMISLLSMLMLMDATTIGTLLLEQNHLFGEASDVAVQNWMSLGASLDYLANQSYWLEASLWTGVWFVVLVTLLQSQRPNPRQWPTLDGVDGLSFGAVATLGAVFFGAGLLSLYMALLFVGVVVLFMVVHNHVILPRPTRKVFWMNSGLAMIAIACWAFSESARVEMADSVRPQFMRAAALDLLGTSITDATSEGEWQGIRARVEAPFAGLREGDLIVAFDSLPVQNTQDLLTQLTVCACETGVPKECVRPKCLVAETPVQLSLLRRSAAGTRPEMLTVSVMLNPDRSAPSVEDSDWKLTHPQASVADQAIFAQATQDLLRMEVGLAERRLLSLNRSFSDDPALAFLNGWLAIMRNEQSAFKEALDNQILPHIDPTTRLGQVVTLARQQLSDPVTDRSAQWHTMMDDAPGPFWRLVHCMLTTLFQLEATDEHMVRLQNAIKDYPDDLVFKYAYIHWLWTNRRLGPAEDALRGALLEARSNPHLVSMRILQWIHLKEFVQARKELEEMLALDPNDGHFYPMLAGVLIELGEQEALSQHIEAIDGLLMPPERKALFWRSIGLDLAVEGRLEEALSVYGRCQHIVIEATGMDTTWSCRIQAIWSSLFLGRVDSAESLHQHILEQMASPDLAAVHTKQMRTWTLASRAMIASNRGDHQAALKDFEVLKTTDSSVYGSHAFFKEHFIQRMRIQLHVAASDLEGLEADLAGFLPALSVNLGPMASHGPKGRLGDWVRAHIARLKGTKEVVEEATSTVLSRTGKEQSMDHFFHPDTLVTLAEAANAMGLEPSTRALLEKLVEQWPQIDTDLPVMQRAATLRSALKMGPHPPFVPPEPSPELLPTESDIQFCGERSGQHSARCEASEQAWCSMSMKPVGCCPPGQIVTDVDLGTCGCAPGGSSGAGMCPKGDMEAFKQAVDLTEKHEEIIDCYRRAFRFYTEIKGRIELSFALGPQGQVLPLGPGSSELHTSPVQTCIHRVLRQTRFSPPLDGYAEIKLPLVFE